MRDQFLFALKSHNLKIKLLAFARDKDRSDAIADFFFKRRVNQNSHRNEVLINLKAAAGDVPSPLAGRVTAVVVTVGQAVKEGDHLLTLEAMKMNTFVFAPRRRVGLSVDVGGVN